MKLYCVKCAAPFDCSASPGSVPQVNCPECGTPADLPSAEIAPGAILGDFLIEKEISRGGMGVVYQARQLSLDRPVALKILLPEAAQDKEQVESLLNEARAAGRLTHPNIVQAYAVGEENGVYYFAMEYIRGETMKQVLAREKVIEPKRAAKIIGEIAAALTCAWRDERLVHQDIKPDNIMIDANGFAKLADLGISRRAGMNDRFASEGDEVMGTPQYISPEQLTGVPTDVRSDIYSLGATFYQFVTGQFPYTASTPEELGRMHLDGKLTSPGKINSKVDSELERIILKMMARYIEDRYQTPEELSADISKYLVNGPKKPVLQRKSAVAPPSAAPAIQKPAFSAPPAAPAPTLPPGAAPQTADTKTTEEKKENKETETEIESGTPFYRTRRGIFIIAGTAAVLAAITGTVIFLQKTPGEPPAGHRKQEVSPTQVYVPVSRPELLAAAESAVRGITAATKPQDALEIFDRFNAAYPVWQTAEERTALAEVRKTASAADDAVRVAPNRVEVRAERERKLEKLRIRLHEQSEAEKKRLAADLQRKEMMAEQNRRAEETRRLNEQKRNSEIAAVRNDFDLRYKPLMDTVLYAFRSTVTEADAGAADKMRDGLRKILAMRFPPECADKKRQAELLNRILPKVADTVTARVKLFLRQNPEPPDTFTVTLPETGIVNVYSIRQGAITVCRPGRHPFHLDLTDSGTMRNFFNRCDQKYKVVGSAACYDIWCGIRPADNPFGPEWDEAADIIYGKKEK